MSKKFEISRVFDASRERVWDAWTKPEQLSHWLAPKGTTSEVKHFELKPGGYLHSKLTGPDGSVSWGKTIYREIDPPRLLVWEQGFANEAGEIIRAPFPMPWTRTMLTTVVFEDEGPRARVTLTWEPVNPSQEELESFAQMLQSMKGGWTGTFDQLDAFLAGAPT
jgi:uncharacterized protein YndB with AHSA1/START domain